MILLLRDGNALACCMLFSIYVRSQMGTRWGRPTRWHRRWARCGPRRCGTPRDVRADALEALAWVAGRPWPEQQALLAGLDAAIAAGAENLGYQHWTLADALAEEE